MNSDRNIGIDEFDIINFDNDKRTICKYGIKCYQKNKEHLKIYKHPPKANSKNLDNVEKTLTPPSKKMKLEVPVTKRMDSFSEIDPNEMTHLSESVISDLSDVPEINLKNSPDSPGDMKERIKEKYLVNMPQDFYELWTYFKTINSRNPAEALKKFGLTAVGPYDIVSGKSKTFLMKNDEEFLCHWRFYYDPPEFQTIIVGCKNEFRIGYFRDYPSEAPVFVASMSSSKQGVISSLGENIFAALKSYLSSQLSEIDLFKKAELSKCIKSLEKYAKDKDISLELNSLNMKARQKKIVSKSFHGAGIIVPVDKKTDVGYREIPETDADLKKILNRVMTSSNEKLKKENLAAVQELMTNAQWATDEGDFGMGFELGIDLFIYGGHEFHSFIKHLLNVSYELLNRQEFATILNAHLKNRTKGHFECM